MTSTTAAPTIPVREGPLLIAVAGLTPRTGVTTTALALARTWPGPEPAVLLEADPAGGQLADLIDGDPYQGLASVSWAAHFGAGPVRLAEHLQTLPGGVGFLAAPPGPDPLRTTWVTMLLTGRHHNRRLDELAAWRELGATVIADCGTPDPALLPLLAGADACLVLVHADLIDPYRTGEQILDLAGHARRPGVLLLGADTDSAIATALRVPVLASVPHTRHAATTLLHRTWLSQRRNRLLHAARAITTTVESQLRPPPAPDTNARPDPPSPRLPRVPRRPTTGPTVYQIGLPTTTPPRGDTLHLEASSAPRRTPPTPAATDSDATATIVPQQPVEPWEPSGPAEPEIPSSASLRPPEAGSAAALSAGSVPEAVPVLSVAVFGPLRVWWRPGPQAVPVEITRSLRRRERDLLIVLAVHPHGAPREALIEALWDEHHQPRRPTNALNTVVSRLRAAITTATADTITEILDNDTYRYRLAPDLWKVDYHAFDTAVIELRTATTHSERERACRAILGAADGVLAEDFAGDWIAPIREHTRRDRLKAVGKLAAMLVETDPDQTLALLETALLIDPTNEPIYQDILRLHARLGERTAINPTLALLKRRLETIGDLPTQNTLNIAKALRDHNIANPDTAQRPRKGDTDPPR
ncbi:winged helix-turn-helix domain-containing protein [Nocardia sp. CA2R105]|uniref:winged helix-turn-helix domain-containing protein n=1 Tax=Nocardia coffeae TaxID=2873381 RepID=UPI001CA61C08|nr:winged helix-turn-helix domain-containing protein [Nocardia coffeae]MBY8855386.1 winged helix-turn-helix domain-containing protein [Nocardia coffeae]